VEADSQGEIGVLALGDQSRSPELTETAMGRGFSRRDGGTCPALPVTFRRNRRKVSNPARTLGTFDPLCPDPLTRSECQTQTCAASGPEQSVKAARPAAELSCSSLFSLRALR
jgi:hypothetical protein